LNVFAQEKIKRVLPAAYNPDSAPSDFFLFGYMKQKLTECDIPDRESLKCAITRIFDEIGQEMLTTVFDRQT
jgi:hypothetical protein